ncbi:MAG TPA: glycine--tRNA ligase [Candidatus Sulfotelmatobacter sp.]|jgi:glycyl-tRNA synthetase|nr:glycine--tRNA ligase [Candidatus Sulfotelmatobacter sp.]
MAETATIMDKIVSLAKRRGFIYPGSELYGGLANTYDYGPVGAELLRNIKNLWWKYFVQTRPDMVGLDGSIISHHKIWEASGHVSGFVDAMVDCKNCHARMRADHLIENYLESIPHEKQSFASQPAISDDELKKVQATGKVEGLSDEKLTSLIEGFNIICPSCGKHNWTKVRKFNLLFPIQLGIVEGEGGMGYLRGETAQLIFTNFHNVINSTRVRLPFGIAQLGKSFRNEITPGNSIFRTIEFEQGEIEYFFDPDETKWESLYEQWKGAMDNFVTKELGIKKENLRWRAHPDEERSFYSKRTEDLEYKFPFGFKELWGLAYRTNYDLTKHQEASMKDLTIVDPKTGKKVLPHVIEPAVGINRLLLMVLADAYTEEEKRIVLKIAPKLAPYKIAVFPLLANKEELVSKAQEVFALLSPEFMTAFDDRGNIGKRYLSQDEIGTPWCVTIDFETLDNETVTVRDRDTMQQERITINDLTTYFTKKLV